MFLLGLMLLTEHCALDLVISMASSLSLSSSAASNGIDLVNEENAGPPASGHLEKLTDHTGTFSNIPECNEEETQKVTNNTDVTITLFVSST